MLIIENVSKIFSYNWSLVFKDLIPNGNKAIISSQSVKGITYGSIIRILGVVFSQVAIIGLAIYLVFEASSSYGLSGLYAATMPEVISQNIGKWIIDIIIAAIVPIAALVFVKVMENKKQTSWPYFILMIIALAQTVYSVYGIIGWLAGIIISPIFAIIGLISVAIALLGNINIVVGCLDFCQQLFVDSVAQNIQQNIQPIQSVQPLQQWPQPQQVQQLPQQPITPAAQPVVNQTTPPAQDFGPNQNM